MPKCPAQLTVRRRLAAILVMVISTGGWVPQLAQTCHNASYWTTPSDGYYGLDGKRHVLVGKLTVSGEVDLALIDAVGLLNSKSDRTGIVLHLQNTWGHVNVGSTADPNLSFDIATWDPQSTMVWYANTMDGANGTAANNRLGVTKILAHELAHFLGLNEGTPGGSSLMDQCIIMQGSSDPAGSCASQMASRTFTDAEADKAKECLDAYNVWLPGEDEYYGPYDDTNSQDPEDYQCFATVKIVRIYACGSGGCRLLDQYTDVIDRYCIPM